MSDQEARNRTAALTAKSTLVAYSGGFARYTLDGRPQRDRDRELWADNMPELLAGVMHLADMLGVSFAEVLTNAQELYAAQFDDASEEADDA